MSIRSVEGVFVELKNAYKRACEDSDNEIDNSYGSKTAFAYAIYLLGKVDSCDISKLQELAAKFVPVVLLIIIPIWWS